MPSVGTYVKAITAGAALCIGGPALVWYVTPTEEEIFKKYNPDLQKRALATREQRQQDFDAFVCQLKEASKSDKPIWVVQKEMEKKRAEENAQRLRDERDALAAEAERRRAEIRSSAK
ncbi:CBP4-domain-containing protein [Trematosphaeria pertusa]|uniref:Cytochrome b mRNA-processing protein 4 n=1 Tax=Trematosphaeria pertusa TaxID=390896 RepID=A0A6A6J4W5_9PLEO|nr:CBP4-domain-containing protein [Trematosphaeria pertusa]KAF2257272.1 CBP4-domain-containing protein [Trematosphaeria pertusa]